jgi:hypothetical protein
LEEFLYGGFTVLRYDKRGIGTNHTIVDSDIWGNLTIDDLRQDAEKGPDDMKIF